MDRVCLVIASHTWMDGARPVKRAENGRKPRTGGTENLRTNTQGGALRSRRATIPS